VPVPDPARSTDGTRPRRRRRPAYVRCESCLDVLSLGHAWDVRSCSCGALLLSGRPTRPTVHWLSRPGGGWTETGDGGTETGDELDVPDPDGPGAADPDEPSRRFGFSPSAW